MAIFEGSGDFSAESLEMLKVAKKEIMAFLPTGRELDWDDFDHFEALGAFLARGGIASVVVKDDGWLCGSTQRLRGACSRWGHSLRFFLLDETVARDCQDAFVVFDEESLAKKPVANMFHCVVYKEDRGSSRILSERFAALKEHAKEIPMGTTLGL